MSKTKNKMSSRGYGAPQQPQEQEWPGYGPKPATNERHSAPRNQVHTRQDVDNDVEILRKKVLPY